MRNHSRPSGRKAKPAKPAKPYPEFPLTPHPIGQWCKKIRGKLHYFGPWADSNAALEKYLAQKDELHAGRTPRADPNAITVKDVANSFRGSKLGLVEAGELSQRTYDDYAEACAEIVAAFGTRRLVLDLRPDDFARLRRIMAAKWGPHRLSKMIQCVRCAFKYAYDAGLLDRPVRFGPDFTRPKKKTMRIHRLERGAKLFSAEQIRTMIDVAPAPLRAMILLGINCGFGNEDCGRLDKPMMDLHGGWIDFGRPKTGIERRCPLWPETIEAIEEALKHRPKPKRGEDTDRVFLTKYGGSWQEKGNDRPISKAMAKLLKQLSFNGSSGASFYALRHTFRTIGDEAKDQPAVNHIMGHGDPTMAGFYRERISDERLRAVADYVRRWLFPDVSTH